MEKKAEAEIDREIKAVNNPSVQKNFRKVLYRLGSMGCEFFSPSPAEHHPR
jgi:hypothetical protein